MKKIAFLSLAIGLITVALLMLTTASATLSAPEGPVVFTKETSNPTPELGEIYIYTLRFGISSAGSLPIDVRVTDPNPNPAHLTILPGSVTGGASYDPNSDSIVWVGRLIPGSLPNAVTFRVWVTAPVDDPDGLVITNTASMVDTAHPGLLPLQQASVPVTIFPTESRVQFAKIANNLTPKNGDRFTYTLIFSSSPTENQPIHVKVMDPNPAPEYLQIVPTSVTGDGYYDPFLDGIVWEGTIVPGSLPIMVKFDVIVTGLPLNIPLNGYEVTNTAYMVDTATPGSLPFQLASVKVNLLSNKWYLPIVFSATLP